MKLPGIRRPYFLLFVILLPLVSIVISYYAFRSKEETFGNELPYLYPGDSIPDFTLISHTGDTITRDSLRGKIVVADFFFTSCRGICPDMSKQMGRLHRFLSKNETMKSKVILLSHTVDPGSDSVATLKMYADLYGADGKMWHLLTGDRQQLYDLAIKFYRLPALATPEDTIHPYAHSERFTLIDRKGFIRGYYSGTDSIEVNKLISNIGKLDVRDNVRRRKKK